MMSLPPVEFVLLWKFIPFWRAGAGKSTLSESELDHSLARLLLAFLLLSDGPPPWCNCFLWHSAVTAEVNDITLPLLTCLSQETCVYFYLPVYNLRFTFHMVTDMHTDYVGIKISCLKIFQMPNIATLRKSMRMKKMEKGQIRSKKRNCCQEYLLPASLFTLSCWHSLYERVKRFLLPTKVYSTFGETILTPLWCD